MLSLFGISTPIPTMTESRTWRTASPHTSSGSWTFLPEYHTEAMFRQYSNGQRVLGHGGVRVWGH